MRELDLAPFARTTVGFDRLFSLLDRASDATNGFPPYNIEQSSENNYRITLAVAGFRENELTAEVRDGVLIVSGHTEEATKNTFLYRGIAGRQFERRFQLAEHVEVHGAKLENGLLQIDLERVVPEEKKPRRIAINANGPRSIETSKAA